MQLYLRPLPILLIAVVSCSEGTKPDAATSNWTENQEIHFYNDCKGKMIENGDSEAQAHAFCECCLLALKDKFENGKEAMENLTDDQIIEIEKGCFE